MNRIITDKEAIDQILDRGTIKEVLPSGKEFKDKLLSGDRLRFYIGFDATASNLHLSHAKNFLLLEKFRKLGHEVIVLFGDFTARIGDPTGENSARKQLTREEVLSNVERWKDLIKPLMSFNDKDNPPQIKYNHDWLSKLTFEDILKLSSNFTVQQMIERDMFQKRLGEKKPIYLHEFFYPLMQGYDSVAMDVDVEMCGTDQIFNAMMGRSLQKKINNKEKFVVAVTLMENPKTGELMSKSKGTGVFLGTSPSDMFGQIMSQPDEMIEILFINNTNLSKKEISEILSMKNPKDMKMRLASEIVKIFHGEEKSKEAEKAFTDTFSKKELPTEMPVVNVKGMDIIGALVEGGIISSKSESKRVLEQKGIKVNQEIISDVNFKVKEGDIIQKGKISFFRVG